MKIQTKIQWFAIMWLLIIVLIISIGVYFLFSNLLIDNELGQLEEHTVNIASFIKPDPALPANPLRMLRAYLPPEGMIRIVNETADAFIVLTQRPELSEIATEFSSSQLTYVYDHADGEKFAVSRFPMIWEDGAIVTLEVTESLRPIQDTLRLLRVVLSAAALFILLPAMIGGKLLSQLILRPIQSMIHTMQEIQQRGTLKKIRIDQQSNDELYQLGSTFNKMIDLLKQNFARQQQFVSDASHELKTPLTVIESYANMLKRWGMKKADILEESIEAIHSESRRMRELTEQMLALAEDHSDQQLNLQDVDLVAFCGKAVSTFATSRHREINILAEAECVSAQIDEKRCQQVLFILLDNAIKYSDAPIDVLVGEEPRSAYFSVRDRGIGIPADELDHVFDRFYRVDRVRSRETGGTGLGLAIAQNIIHAQQGSIEVHSVEGVGTSFTVKCKRSKKTQENTL